MSPRKTSTFALPASASPIATPTRKRASSCAAIGPLPAKAAPSRGSAPPAKERRITRWEHAHVLEAVQRRETVEHPFGTIKARMGATHFLMKRLKNVRTEMALSVLAYNLTRVMNILGIEPLMAAMRA